MIEKENLKYSAKNLYSRKSRSILTILSIFIGIATIFIFASFGWGLYDYTNSLASEAGVDKFFIQAKGIGAPGVDTTFKLLDEDLDETRKTPGVKEVSAYYIKAAQIEKGRERRYVYMTGHFASEQDKRMLTELSGIDVFTGRDLKKGDKGKVMLGHNYLLEDKIFERPVRLGEKLIINGARFEVVGFYEPIGNPIDDSNIYVTADDIKALFGEDVSYGFLIGTVNDKDRLDPVVDLVTKRLRNLRGQDEGKEDFFVQTFEDAIAQFSAVLNIIIGFVILIALISVLVSAVNTANTMITSVLERTNEIGVMKAIGARNSTIRNIFLLESAMLGLVAGVIGVAIGAAFSSFAGSVLKNLGWGFLSPKYSPVFFVVLILFAVVVGTLSGVTVAIQASKQNAVDALRYE